MNSFDSILAKARQNQAKKVAENSQNNYHTYLKLYEETMTNLNTDPYDINLEKMMVFIQYQKDSGLEYSSLQSCISSLSSYFRSRNQRDLTLDEQFIDFQKGLLHCDKYRIINHAGVQTIIEKDGIWVKVGDEIQKHYFPEPLDENWFQNPKAYTSISGSFTYLIVDGELRLLTLASDESKKVYVDILEKGIKFNDANFSYEETILYALTDSSIFLFSLLPPKKIQEFIYEWKYIGTSFKLLCLPLSDDYATDAFLIESKFKDKVKTKFFSIPEDYTNPNPYRKLILSPIDEKKSLFSSYEDNLFQFKQDTRPQLIIDSSNVENPKSLEEGAQNLLDKGKELKKAESKLEKRTKRVCQRSESINKRYAVLKHRCDICTEKSKSLFARFQRLIETADGGVNLVQKSNEQRYNHELLTDLVNAMEDKDSELDEDIIFEYRSLERLLSVLQYNFNLLKKNM